MALISGAKLGPYEIQARLERDGVAVACAERIGIGHMVVRSNQTGDYRVARALHSLRTLRDLGGRIPGR